MAQADFTGAIALVDLAIELTNACELGRYLPEAFYLKGKAHSLLGALNPSRLAFEQARGEAEKREARRFLWQIMAGLAEIKPDHEQSLALKKRYPRNRSKHRQHHQPPGPARRFPIIH